MKRRLIALTYKWFSEYITTEIVSLYDFWFVGYAGVAHKVINPGAEYHNH